MTDLDGVMEGLARELAAPEAGPGPTSEGQAMLNRMLAQCNRYTGLLHRLDKVLITIAPSGTRRSPGEPAPLPIPATSFFNALKLLADCNDKIAADLEESIGSIERLF